MGALYGATDPQSAQVKMKELAEKRGAKKPTPPPEAAPIPAALTPTAPGMDPEPEPEPAEGQVITALFANAVTQVRPSSQACCSRKFRKTFKEI